MARKGWPCWGTRVLQSLKRLGGSRSAHVSEFEYLNRLQNELKVIISGYLACNDLLALALCSHSWMNLIGKAPFEEFHIQHITEREDFFLRLDRDLPYPWTACTRCLRVHIPPPADLRHVVDEWEDAATRDRIQKRACFNIDRSNNTGRTFAPCIRFEQVQLAMKLHRQGLDTKKFVDSLNVIPVDPYRDDHLISFEGRILYNRFFMKRQEWLIYPDSIRSPPTTGPILGLFGPCSHSSRSFIWTGYPGMEQWFDKERRAVKILQEMRKDDYWHKHPQTKMVTSDLHQCDHCATEYRLSCGLFGQRQAKYEGHHTVVLTTWMCLGEGRTPQDWYWANYIWPHRDGLSLEMRRFGPQHRSVAFTFEGRKFGYEDLQPRWTDAMERAWTQEKQWQERHSN